MTQPDIVFVVLDTQRADRLSCYGYDKPTTPHIDAFAERGVLFEQAIAPAQWTIPSHASFFTGLYPTAHQVTQSNQTLSPDRPHLVELLKRNGYDTLGFCNNPLVGVLDNGFKEGFQTFYNYGGAIPTVPKSSSRLPFPLNRIATAYTQFLRRISYPIQNFFGQSELAFSISLNAWLTPLWLKLANFKGQNARSVRDVTRFLADRKPGEKPLFLFLNLMETHLPFAPPKRFAESWSVDMQTHEGRKEMGRWNRESFRWGAPLPQPLSPVEDRLLSDMYDAEVAYQDEYLAPLLAQLAERENTLTIIVADHGDGLGEHDFMGHAFVAYQELVHVPLILHWGRDGGGKMPASTRIQTPVSTRRVYHTILDAAQISETSPGLDIDEVHDLSLKHTIFGKDPENGTAYAEIYPPTNFVKAVSDRFPELIEQFRCQALRRAVVKDDLKLIQVENVADELFDLNGDPKESQNVLTERPENADILKESLERMVNRVEVQRNALTAGSTLALEDDEQLLQRLRGLGYIE
jgi:uncharacterized sulfatase